MDRSTDGKYINELDDAPLSARSTGQLRMTFENYEMARHDEREGFLGFQRPAAPGQHRGHDPSLRPTRSFESFRRLTEGKRDGDYKRESDENFNRRAVSEEIPPRRYFKRSPNISSREESQAFDIQQSSFYYDSLQDNANLPPDDDQQDVTFGDDEDSPTEQAMEYRYSRYLKSKRKAPTTSSTMTASAPKVVVMKKRPVNKRRKARSRQDSKTSTINIRRIAEDLKERNSEISACSIGVYSSDDDLDIERFHRSIDRNCEIEDEGQRMSGPISHFYADMGILAPVTKIKTLNIEAHSRTLCLSYTIMLLALVSASAAQLRYFLAYSQAASYPVLSFFLVYSSFTVELLVAVGYICLSRFAFRESTRDKINSYLIFGLYIIAMANVIIAAFCFDDHVCEMLARNIGAGKEISQPKDVSKISTPKYNGADTDIGKSPP